MNSDLVGKVINIASRSAKFIKEYAKEKLTEYLDQLGAKLTTLTAEQAEYIDVPVEGPYKPEHYRY